MTTRRIIAILAYVVPTFALGFTWHLMLFKDVYAAFAIYRSDIIVPFGLLSMLIQATIFAWLYERTFARHTGSVLGRDWPTARPGRRCPGAIRPLLLPQKTS